jgi:IS5 family transposase
MYKSLINHQISFFDFNQSCGMQLDPNNEWVRLADSMPWNKLEEKYSAMFPSTTGRPAKPFQMAFGALIIQKRKKLSDRALVREIAENPYLQYFLGVEKFQHECPFTAPLLVLFRKRLNSEFLIEANEIYLQNAPKTNEHLDDKEETPGEGAENLGTQILDATCSPSHIEYP